MSKHKMREEFEAWWRRKYESTLYCESAWRGWQASRAASAVQGEVGEGVPDYINDAIDNLEHDNYEQGYAGYLERKEDISIIRAYVARTGQPAEQQREPCHECGGNGAGGEHEDDCSQQPAPDVAGLVEALEGALSGRPLDTEFWDRCEQFIAAHRKGGDA